MQIIPDFFFFFSLAFFFFTFPFIATFLRVSPSLTFTKLPDWRNVFIPIPSLSFFKFSVLKQDVLSIPPLKKPPLARVYVFPGLLSFTPAVKAPPRLPPCANISLFLSTYRAALGKRSKTGLIRVLHRV